MTTLIALVAFICGACVGLFISALCGASDDTSSRLRQDYERERSRQPWQT